MKHYHKMKYYHNLLIWTVLWSCFLGGTTSWVYASENVSAPLYHGPEQLISAPAPYTYAPGTIQNSWIYVSCTDSHHVMVLDSHRWSEGVHAIIGDIPLDGRPTGLCVSKDGKYLYITWINELSCGFVSVLSIASKDTSSENAPNTTPRLVYEEIARWAAGHTPVSPVLLSDKKMLWFLRRFTGELVQINTSNGEICDVIPLNREPMVMRLTPDGSQLVIAHHLPIRDEIHQIYRGLVTLFDLPTKQKQEIYLPDGTSGIYDLAITEDGRYAYIPHTLGHHSLLSSQVEMGWIINNGISIIDLKKRSFLNTILLDGGNEGMANPWAVTSFDHGGKLAFTVAGKHQLAIFDLPKAMRQLQISYPNPIATALVGAKSPVYDSMIRTPVNGKSPRGIMYTNGQIFVTSYFSDLVDVFSSDGVFLATIPLGARPGSDENPWTDLRKGEQIFSDADYCYQTWLSCVTCHPEARMDGMRWDLLNDGIGNSKSTKSMLYTLQTPPSMALGVRDTGEAAVRAGFIHIMFKEADESDCLCVDAYLKNLKPLSSPYRLANGELSGSAKRGEAIFEQHCSYCHYLPIYTDLKRHDVGTKSAEDFERTYDTPILYVIWRTAPYLHDGSAKTVRESLSEKHGHIHQLSDTEMEDLIHFVLSL
ncbi:MAG: hypothetical protein PHE53_10755 [Thermoguttaceae bacterium]|nr:hypothetical protein [Thermoguttaceae bacterium]